MTTLLINRILHRKNRLKEVFPTLLVVPMLLISLSNASTSNAAEQVVATPDNTASQQRQVDHIPKKIVCGDAGTFILHPNNNTIVLPNWQSNGKSKTIRALFNNYGGSMYVMWTINYPDPKRGTTIFSYGVKENDLYYNPLPEHHGHKVSCKAFDYNAFR